MAARSAGRRDPPAAAGGPAVQQILGTRLCPGTPAFRIPTGSPLRADAPEAAEGTDEDLPVRNRQRRVRLLTRTEPVDGQDLEFGVRVEDDRVAAAQQDV